MQYACIGDELHAHFLCRINYVFMFGGARSDCVRRDQKQFLHAGKGGLNRLGLCVVEFAHLHAHARKILRLLRRTDSGYDL